MSNHLQIAHFCPQFAFIFSLARKRTLPCNIPETVRGSWKEEFTGTEKKIRLDIDIGATSATLHINVEDPSSSGALTSQVEFECLSESDDGLFLSKDKLSKEILKWSDIR